MATAPPKIKIELPTAGLHLAMDPRIPDDSEVFPFEVTKHPDIYKVNWYLDQVFMATTRSHRYNWRLTKGKHRVQAKVWLKGASEPVLTEKVFFVVK